MTTSSMALALCASLIWASSLVVNKWGLRYMDLVPYCVVRSAVGLALIALYGLARGSILVPNPGLAGIALAAGVMDLGIAMTLFLYALKRIPAHQAIPLASTAPFWAVVASIAFLGEALRWYVVVSAVLVVLGSWLLAPPAGQHRRLTPGIGAAAALGSAVLIGIADTVIARYCITLGMSPTAFQLLIMVAGMGFWCLAFLLGGKRSISRFKDGRGLRAAILTAFAGFFAAPILWFSALSATPASLLAPVRSLIVVASFGLSVLFLHEKVTKRATVGALLSFIAVALVSALG